MVFKFQTTYDALPFQALMIKAVKEPLMSGVNVLFDSDASKISKLRGLNNIWKALKAIAGFPSSTKENTWHPNAHNLIDLRDYALACLAGETGLHPVRRWFVRNVFNLAIIIYNYDPPWRWIMDSVKDKALTMEWKKRGYSDDWQKWGWYQWWHEDESNESNRQGN